MTRHYYINNLYGPVLLGGGGTLEDVEGKTAPDAVFRATGHKVKRVNPDNVFRCEYCATPFKYDERGDKRYDGSKSFLQIIQEIK